MRRGVTLLELMAVLAIIGIASAFAVPRVQAWLDRLAVEQAVSDLTSFYRRARLAAVFQNTSVRVEFSADTLRAYLEFFGGEEVLLSPGPARHGASLAASRRTIRFNPNGLGMGGANTRLVVMRGLHAETLTTSRLGRLKRW